MSDAKTRAEVFVYGLINGLVEPIEVTQWAETLLAAMPEPESWILDVCTGELPDPKDLVSILHTVPGSCNSEDVNHGIAELLSRKNKPFDLFAPDLLPPSFTYPRQLVEYARLGKYPYNPAVWFIDASFSHARSLLGHVKDINPAYMPFAQIDDRFPCLNSNNDNEVVVVDIVERTVSPIGSVESWFNSYQAQADGYAWYAGH